MIFELILILCMSPNECATDRTQMGPQVCIERSVEAWEKYGKDVDEPPYLRENPACVLRYVRR